MKTFKNEDGFSFLHTLLLLIVVGIVGYTGWYVWNTNKETNKNFKIADSTVGIKKSNPGITQPTDDTKVKIQAKDGFSFEYPKNWEVIAYSADETINGGQVAADDKKAIEWRLLSRNSSINAMCVEVNVSNLNNAGIIMSQTSPASNGSGDNKIWIGERGDVTYAVLRSNHSTDNYLTLGADKALTVYAGYDCAQRMTTTYSKEEQQKTQEFQEALNILQSVRIDTSTAR